MRKSILAILFFGGAMVFAFSARALTISPVKIEISGDPGKAIEGELTLYNEQGDTKTFYSSTDNFEARGETGAPFFLSERVGLATWIKVEDQVTLKPKEQKTIPYRIQIPKNAEPGGHFAGILWGTTPPGDAGHGQVAVGGKLGVLVLLRVSGAVKEGGGLLEFSAAHRFASALPIAFTYRFNNTGGNGTLLSGEVLVKNLFGFTVATLSANENNGSVLPGSSRKFSVAWGAPSVGNEVDQTDHVGFFEAAGREWSNFHLGWYTGVLNLRWGGTNGQTARSTYNFFVIPWQLLIIILAIVLLLGKLGFIGIQRYNRWIIAQARLRK